MRIVHLAASPFLGGPESQILGLIRHFPPEDSSAVLSFSEGGKCRPFLQAAREAGAEAIELASNVPRFRASVKEISDYLRTTRADILFCHGYKPKIFGLLAARRSGLPVVGVSHGYTSATWKVVRNETLGRLSLFGMTRVVCVSERQARRVRAFGVPAGRVAVIPNAIDASRFTMRDESGRERLKSLFPPECQPRMLVGSAGRLSPEKGCEVLVEAAAKVIRERPDVGFIHCGDGPLREAIRRRIRELKLEQHFILEGFRSDLNQVYPALDLFALPSYTEGMPVVVLEALASGVPVIATAVGGTPEIVREGENGRMVPPGDPTALARRMLEMLEDPESLRILGRNGRARVLEEFTVELQARRYHELCLQLVEATRQRSKHAC